MRDLRVPSADPHTHAPPGGSRLYFSSGEGVPPIGCRSGVYTALVQSSESFKSLSLRFRTHGTHRAVSVTLSGPGSRTANTRPIDAACCTNVLANARLATLTQRGRRLPRGVHRF